MKGVDNLGYRTMFEDVKEYLEIINELKDKKMDILQNSDIINNDQLQKVIHEIFEALLFIAQFS
jgi:DNA-directed RNA polymerase beta subunit